MQSAWDEVHGDRGGSVQGVNLPFRRANDKIGSEEVDW